jgi:hypothetical protein
VARTEKAKLQRRKEATMIAFDIPIWLAIGVVAGVVAGVAMFLYKSRKR